MPAGSLRRILKSSGALRWLSFSRKAPRLCSRLVNCLLPGGRGPEISGSGRATYPKLVGREGRAAAAGRGRLWVLDREAAASDGIHEINLGALEVTDADRVDEQLHAVRLEHLVARALAVLFDHQAV